MPSNTTKPKRNSSSTNLTKALLVIYLVILCWILLLKLGVQFSYMSTRSVNLIPFSGGIDKVEMILNVLIFIPAGIYAGVIFKTCTRVQWICSFFLLSLVFEAMQFIFRIGSFDATDIITNTLGGVIGIGILSAIEKLFNNSVRAYQFINIIAATGTVLFIALLVLLKLNMLPVLYQ